MHAGTVRNRNVAIAIGVILLGLSLNFLNRPGGPVEETTGIVQSYGFLPRDTGPPHQVATVRLKDGMVVQAEVHAGVLVQANQVARLRVLRRVVSGAPSYQLVAMEPKK
jgi:hypothetical protein